LENSVKRSGESGVCAKPGITIVMPELMNEIRRMKMLRWIVASALMLTSIGCASYVTPGGPADLSVMGVTDQMKAAKTPNEIQSSFDRKPLATFPTSIAVARVQASGYSSRSNVSYGSGAYSVVTTRDIETDEDIARITKQPMIRSVAPIQRMILPAQLTNDEQLRSAAASLHAEMLMIYTIDTQFYVDDFAKPLTVISLGLSPNRKARVVSTAAMVLMDTRTGYIYGLAEATEQDDQLASAWTSESAIEQTRKRTERGAFTKLLDEFEKNWKGVVAMYAVHPTNPRTP